MIWLFVIGLGVWCAFQQSQLAELRRKFNALAPERPKLSPERPVAAAEREAATEGVSFLADPAPSPSPEPEVLISEAPEVAEAAPFALPEDLTEIARPPRLSVSDWLSQNGLAWIGGGALALGGLFLVAYAAQRGLFNPAFRIAAAVVLGLAALAAGEALRRGFPRQRPPNLLVAALTTAAGAGIIYAAIWAAYRLYGFIPGPVAVPLLAATSLGLLLLALLHGEALGILAIAAAYAVPVVSGAGDWSGLPLDGFAALVLATGLAVAGLRRWAPAGAVALVGAGLWVIGRSVEADALGVCLLAALAAALTLAASIFAKRPSASPDRFDRLLPAAIIGASLFAALVWWSLVPREALYAAVATASIILATAAGVRLAKASPLLLIAPAALLACAALSPGDLAVDRAKAIGFLLALLCLLAAGFDGAMRSDRRREAAVIGAAGAVLALTLFMNRLAQAAPGWDWVIDAAFAAVIASGAALLRRQAEDPETDLATAAWIAAAAEAAGLALHAGLDWHVAPTAYGLLALVLAGLSLRFRWRGFAESAAAACLAGFAALFAPAITWAAIDGDAGWLMTAAVGGGATLAQVAAWRVLKARRDTPSCAEAASTLAVMSGLLTVFLMLQALHAPHGGPALLDDFTRASIRTVLFLAAGLMLSIRGAATPIGRWRAPAFLAIGAAHGFFLEIIARHPWWGLGAPVAGPPVFDSLLLGLLAPALILLEAARRLARQWRKIAAVTVGFALLFFIVWIVTELRRLFHGPDLAGDFGYAETAAYAAAALAIALGLMRAGDRLRALIGETGWLETSLTAQAWFGLVLSVWLLSFIASPWWGPLDGDLRAPALLGLLYAAGCGLSAGMALLARRNGRIALAHAALSAAAVLLFVLLTLSVRFLFHGDAMRAPLREASLETWTFSAIWAIYGLAVLAAGAARKDVTVRWLGLAILLATTLKVFLFDMARLEGVVRAASFLALGLVLLVGALAARRLSGGRETGAS